MYTQVNTYNWKKAKERLRKVLLRKPQRLPKDFKPEDVVVSLNGYYWNGPSHKHIDVVIFDFPYDPTLRNKLLHQLKVLGWNEQKRSLEKGDDCFWLTHPKEHFWIRLDFEWFTRGSTCERVKIGEETVTRQEPIYEIVCEEGANESPF